jgi:caa(3)-type oxidase subunit IV
LSCHPQAPRGAGVSAMSESHRSADHAGSGVTPYLVIFGALVVFTTISFVVNGAVRGETIQAATGFTIILAVAVCKAVLVAMFFMHLKWDWARLYFMIVPVLILGTMLVIVLLPDIVLAWHQK